MNGMQKMKGVKGPSLCVLLLVEASCVGLK